MILVVKFLNSWITDDRNLHLAFIIILIILFWILKIQELYARITPENYAIQQNGMEIWKVNCS